jgi:hypothetical protein
MGGPRLSVEVAVVDAPSTLLDAAVDLLAGMCAQQAGSLKYHAVHVELPGAWTLQGPSAHGACTIRFNGILHSAWHRDHT